MKDIVSLKNPKGKSLRFLISPTVRESLNINSGDTLKIFIYGIFEEGNKMKELDPVIPMPSTVVKAGQTSRGITVKKEIVELFNLKEGQMIAVDIQKKED